MSDTQKKASWGGRRAGAGRPKSKYSLRSAAQQTGESVSSIKTAKFIRRMAPDLFDKVNDEGSMTLRQARAIVSQRLLSAYPRLLWMAEMDPSFRRKAERRALLAREGLRNEH
jgi:hypothetical protein